MDTARRLALLAADLHDLANAMSTASRSIARAERLIGEAERIADDVRRTVRGSGHHAPPGRLGIPPTSGTAVSKPTRRDPAATPAEVVR